MERFNIELKKRDCSGIYAVTQRLMTYNSNKIAGSTLTEEQIAFLFDTGSLPPSDYDYRSEDEEVFFLQQKRPKPTFFNHIIVLIHASTEDATIFDTGF